MPGPWRQFPIILPHELVPWILRDLSASELDEVAGSAGERRKLWLHVSAGHPGWNPCPHNESQLPDYIPVGLHGDDFRFSQSGSKLLTLTLNFPLGYKRQRFPLFLIRVEPQT